MTSLHHAVFRKFQPYSGPVPSGFQVDFSGALMCRDFVEGASASPPEVVTGYPPIDEEYFEWIDILESVFSAHGRYVMFELGAGFGRWAVRAACALRQRGTIKCHLVAVEAEPQHFDWLRQHFRNNNINPDEHTLLHAVVANRVGDLFFRTSRAGGRVDRPDQWYGQAIERWYQRLALVRNRNGARSIKVPSVSLQSLLRNFDRVDLIDLDLQGEEFKVIQSALDEIDSKVARLHIGTHAHHIDVHYTERRLRNMLGRRGWRCTADYPCHSVSLTPFGRVKFEDGVQSWTNPRLVNTQ